METITAVTGNQDEKKMTVQTGYSDVVLRFTPPIYPTQQPFTQRQRQRQRYSFNHNHFSPFSPYPLLMCLLQSFHIVSALEKVIFLSFRFSHVCYKDAKKCRDDLCLDTYSTKLQSNATLGNGKYCVLLVNCWSSETWRLCDLFIHYGSSLMIFSTVEKRFMFCIDFDFC